MTWNNDMSAAPRDGTVIDLWVVYSNGVNLDKYRLIDCRWRDRSASFEEGWHDNYGNKIEWQDEDCKRYVAAWQHLPTPPQEPDNAE